MTTARGVSVVPLKEIDWIESADNYARILSDDPATTLDHLFETLVASAGSHSQGERGVSQA